jgi:hypothetical protein
MGSSWQSSLLTFTLDTSSYTAEAIAFSVLADLYGLATGSYRFTLLGD